nr:uncharacterized protein LOC113404212 [Vanessa tameamea]
MSIGQSQFMKLKTDYGRIVTSKPELLGEDEKHGYTYTSTQSLVSILDPRATTLNQSVCMRTSPIRLQDLNSKAIQLKRGIKQRDVTSPKLFTTAFKDVFKFLDWKRFSININDEYITDLRFANATGRYWM